MVFPKIKWPFLSKPSSPTNSTPSLLCKYESSNRSPAWFTISGNVEVEGFIKPTWLNDIVKRIAIVMAVHLVNDYPFWHPLIPFIAVTLYKLLEERTTFFAVTSRGSSSRLRSQVKGKYYTILSYIPHGTPPMINHVKHSWEFLSPSGNFVIIHYDISIVTRLYFPSIRDHLAQKGFTILLPVESSWDKVCSEVLNSIDQNAYDPNAALELLSTHNKQLKKLYKHKLTSHSATIRIDPSAPPLYETLETPSPSRGPMDPNTNLKIPKSSSINYSMESFNSKDFL